MERTKREKELIKEIKSIKKDLKDGKYYNVYSTMSTEMILFELKIKKKALKRLHKENKIVTIQELKKSLKNINNQLSHKHSSYIMITVLKSQKQDCMELIRLKRKEKIENLMS